MPARTATDLFAATARLLTATVGRVEADALMVNIVCVSVCRPRSERCEAMRCEAIDRWYARCIPVCVSSMNITPSE